MEDQGTSEDSDATAPGLATFSDLIDQMVRESNAKSVAERLGVVDSTLRNWQSPPRGHALQPRLGQLKRLIGRMTPPERTALLSILFRQHPATDGAGERRTDASAAQT